MMKSNGGVFGRNPTFQNVTVDGILTANNGISVSSGNIAVPSGSGISFAATSDPSIAAVAATGSITRTATNVSNNDTVTVGAQVYTFKTTLTPADYEVLIGADSTASLLNLARAINNSGGTPGTDYQVPAANASATAGTAVGTVLPITAISAGAAGDSIALAETSAQLSVSAATLLGGRDAQGMTGETLNDYEIGTWSPRFYITGGSSQIISQSVEVFMARYVKVGSLAYVACWIRTKNIDLVTTGSTRIGITNLPYVAAGTSNEAQSLAVSQSTTWSTAPRGAISVPGQVHLYFTNEPAATGTNYLDGNAFSAGTGDKNLISISGCYQTS
jgi:hypothetical protein